MPKGLIQKQRKLHDSGEKGDKCSIILEWATQVTSSVQTEGLPLARSEDGSFTVNHGKRILVQTRG